MRRKSIVGGGALICLAPDELGHLFSNLSSGDQRLLFLSRIYFWLGFIFVSDPQKDYMLIGLLLWSFDPTTVKLVGFHLWSLIQNMVKLVGPDPDSELTNFHRFPPISRPLIWQFNLVWTTHKHTARIDKSTTDLSMKYFCRINSCSLVVTSHRGFVNCSRKQLGRKITDRRHTLRPCVTARWICKRRNPRSLTQSLNRQKSPSMHDFILVSHWKEKPTYQAQLRR